MKFCGRIPPSAPAGHQVLLDKQAIHEALIRYCRGVDRCDLQLAMTAFLDDAVDNHMGFEMPAIESMSSLLGADQSQVKCTSHNITNELVEVTGDVARSEAYFVAYHLLSHDDTDFDWTVGGRYIDRFERRDGSWRIAHRTVVYDWQPPVSMVFAGETLSCQKYPSEGLSQRPLGDVPGGQNGLERPRRYRQRLGTAPSGCSDSATFTRRTLNGSWPSWRRLSSFRGRAGTARSIVQGRRRTPGVAVAISAAPSVDSHLWNSC